MQFTIPISDVVYDVAYDVVYYVVYDVTFVVVYDAVYDVAYVMVYDEVYDVGIFNRERRNLRVIFYRRIADVRVHEFSAFTD